MGCHIMVRLQVCEQTIIEKEVEDILTNRTHSAAVLAFDGCGTQLFKMPVKETEPSGSGASSYKRASIASNFGDGQWYDKVDGANTRKDRATEKDGEKIILRLE